MVQKFLPLAFGCVLLHYIPFNMYMFVNSDPLKDKALRSIVIYIFIRKYFYM